ncbi:cytochrome c [Tahibacter sp. UC22_41]|uniref:cytochrome c n=1 Tax=Tahibacter sp. UC22_41 TaxID=3350178 RepID=UPI0036DF184A
MSRLRQRLLFSTIVLLPLLLIAAGWITLLYLQQGGSAPFQVPQGFARVVPDDAALIEHGRALARIGNCAGCHTAHGGKVYAGGRAFATPYGTIYSSNLTSDPQHGIGAWSLQEFRHAMRHGVSRNGVQSPVFPYANFARLPDADVDALFAYLATVPAVAVTPPADNLEFPANLPGAMAAWRLLYYRPDPPRMAAPANARGAALVEGIGHCAVCHGTRGLFSSLAEGPRLDGGRVLGWYAPALNAQSLQSYAPGAVAAYLRGAAVDGHAAYGKMADVVAQNLQHLDAADADAVEAYLRALPAPPPSRREPTNWELPSEQRARGDRLYDENCADCHGKDGRGKDGNYPSLVTSSAITGPDPINAIKLTLFGAVGPATPQNPRPYTMPPFAQKLSSADVAALVSTLRARWGANPRPVSPGDVDAWGGIDER